MGRCQKLYAAPASLQQCITILGIGDLVHGDPLRPHGTQNSGDSLPLTAAGQNIRGRTGTKTISGE
jgi:hypothetical protein